MKKIMLIGLMVFLMSSLAFAQPISVEKVSQKHGLDMAIQVADGEAKSKLIEVQNKIMDESLERIQKMEQIKVRKTTNRTFVEGVKKAKFLYLFEVTRNYNYELLEDGELKLIPQPFEFLFQEII